MIYDHPSFMHTTTLFSTLHWTCFELVEDSKMFANHNTVVTQLLLVEWHFKDNQTCHGPTQQIEKANDGLYELNEYVVPKST